MAAFQLDIVTPEKTVYSGMVQSLQAPGVEGSFGILARHIPMLAALDIGPLHFLDEAGSKRQLAVGGGFAEVRPDQVTVLAETAEMAEDIDVSRAQAARDRAEERMRDGQMDAARAKIALARALNRLRISGAG